MRTVIVDEIHAVIGTRRGAHLALSLERLQQRQRSAPLQRIGLSATQKPIEDGRALPRRHATARRRARIVDEGTGAASTSRSRCRDRRSRR